MAEPTDPPQTPDFTGTAEGADQAAASLDRLASSSDAAKSSLGAMETVSDGMRVVFGTLNDQVKAFGFSMENMGSLTEQQTAQFGLLATAVVGARKAFDGLGETRGFSTFTDQFKDLQQVIQNSPMFSTAEGQVKALSDALVKMGAPVQAVAEAAKGGMKAIASYGQAFLTSADSALRLQNIYIQLAAKTGALGNVYKKAGEDLGDLNSLLSAQNKAVSEAATATGISAKDVENFYVTLGQVPKALESTITNADGMSGSMSMLTATIKLAHGTGRDYNEVVKDLHESFTQYGMVGEQALTFTQRFSEISNNFGVELSEVRRELMSTAGAFKNMTDAGDGAAKMSEAVSGLMNDYVGALKNTGMTGTHAMETVRGLTEGMSRLSVAQKAFLSAQSGGAGGLMGAFQIEKMLKEGKIDEVFDKVRGTMQKQFGKIVTLEEASKSPQAASQLEKQMLLLQKGPLGSMVKSDQDAYRLLDAFRAKQEGRAPADKGIGGLDSGGLKNAINAGTEFEKKSYSVLTEMNKHLEALQRAATTSNLNIAQKTGTAGTGARAFLGADTEAQNKMRAGLTGTMAYAGQKSGETTQDYNAVMQGTAPLVDRSGEAAVDAMKNIQGWFSRIPDSLASVRDGLKQAVMTGDEKAVQSKIASLEKDIADRRAAVAGNTKMTAAERQKQLAIAQQEENITKGFAKWKDQYFNTGGAGPRKSLGEMGAPPVQTPGANVGAAARHTPARRTGGTGTAPPGTPDVNVTEHGSGGRIKVDVVVNVKDTGGQGQTVTPVGTP